MDDEKYSREKLTKDLFLMVKAGLLDIYMREDGEWVYKVSEQSLLMTDKEKFKVLDNLQDYDDNEQDR